MEPRVRPAVTVLALLRVALLPALALLVLTLLSSCRADEEARRPPDGGGRRGAPGEPAAEAPGGQTAERQREPTFGGERAVRRARALWDEIDGYADEWERFPGLPEPWQEGTEPHGEWLKVYVNGRASRDATAPGAIIVKENYAAQSDDALRAISVMARPDDAEGEPDDWFWAQYRPGGELQRTEDDRPLAGRVPACIDCHADAGGGDHVFSNDG